MPGDIGNRRTFSPKSRSASRSFRMICSGVRLRRAIVMSLVRPAILGAPR
jgi:hypothetical protein